ncbi:MAG: hypothetical protein ABIA04_07230 [Pseudomonadota bacterium]
MPDKVPLDENINKKTFKQTFKRNGIDRRTQQRRVKERRKLDADQLNKERRDKDRRAQDRRANERRAKAPHYNATDKNFIIKTITSFFSVLVDNFIYFAPK